jgi:hypothetical protein
MILSIRAGRYARRQQRCDIQIGFSLTCLFACGSTVLFSLFLVIFARSAKITKNKKNLPE